MTFFNLLEMQNISIHDQRSRGMKYQPSEIINFSEKLQKQWHHIAPSPFSGDSIQIKHKYTMQL